MPALFEITINLRVILRPRRTFVGFGWEHFSPSVPRSIPLPEVWIRRLNLTARLILDTHLV